MFNVLLIESDADICRRYRRQLFGLGYLVFTVASREQALTTMVSRKIDAVVVEPLLPDCGGLELAEEILVQVGRLPIIVNTNAESYRYDFRSWVADAFISKSDDCRELAETLAGFEAVIWARRRQNERRNRPVPEAVASSREREFAGGLQIAGAFATA